MTVLEIVQMKINDDLILEEDMFLAVDEVGQVIKNYCNISTVPDELKYTWANMAVDLLLYTRVSQADYDTSGDNETIGINDIQKIELGDTELWLGNTSRTSKTSKALDSHSANLDKIVMEYKAQLQKFRRMVW